MKLSSKILSIFLLLACNNILFGQFLKVYATSFTTETGTIVEKVTTQNCDYRDVPDSPARAYYNSNNYITLISSSPILWSYGGENLNQLKKGCQQANFRSHLKPNPRDYNDAEWIVSPYTLDGTNIYALVHNEYHGWTHNDCNYTAEGDFWKCWWNSINLANSNDLGSNFYHNDPPSQVIASSPIDYDINNENNFRGFFEPSNIITKDGYQYAFILSLNNGGTDGTCIMRTNNIADPKSWKLWDGNGFNLSGDRALCKPVIPYVSGGANPHMYLSYNDYLKSYIAVECWYGAGCTYTLSDNLIDWTPVTKFINGPEDDGYKNYCNYASLLQPGDPTRNFELTNRSPWLYFVSTGDNSSCNFQPGGSDKTLYRQRIRFSKPEDLGKYELLDMQFSERSGERTLDSSFYNNNGSLQSALAFIIQNGISYGAFDGNRSVTVLSSPSLNFSGNITIEANIRMSALPAPGTFPAIIQKEELNKRNYGFYITDEGKLHFSLQKGTGLGLVSMNGTKNIVDNTWHRVAVTYDNTSKIASFFIDGVFDRQANLGANMGEVLTTQPVYIAGNNLKADIDFVTAYNYVKYQSPNQPKPGDVTGDGLVNSLDVLKVLNGWGTYNITHLLLTLNNWGK